MRTFTRVVVSVGLLVFGLGAVGIAPAGAGGGGCHRDMAVGPTEGRGEVVELVRFCMTPSVLRVEPGSVVTFANRDEVMHNLYGSGLFVDNISPAGSVGYRFDEEGSFAYACTLHRGMVGAIVVGEGRRLAPDTASIAPTAHQPTSAAPAPTSFAPVPIAAAGDVGDRGEEFPVPAGAALLAAAGVAYVAGRRRRVSAS